ncbi:MAG: hypothetical protein AAFY98_10600, partial [Verrucomicrobiota bacterium]
KMMTMGGSPSELGIGGRLIQNIQQAGANLTTEQKERMQNMAGRFSERQIPSMVDWAELAKQLPALGDSTSRKNAASHLLGMPAHPKLTQSVEKYFQQNQRSADSPISQKMYQDFTYLVLSHPTFHLG